MEFAHRLVADDNENFFVCPKIFAKQILSAFCTRLISKQKKLAFVAAANRIRFGSPLSAYFCPLISDANWRARKQLEPRAI